MVLPRLDRSGLIGNLDALFHPEGRDYTSEQYDDMLLAACANSPDPAASMNMILEASEPVSIAALVDRMLACLPRSASVVSASELSPTHPLRSCTLR